MDVGLLISLVRDRDPLWNRQHPQYKDRELAATLWGQVAGKLGVDVETARYKWRGLRDTYRVQLRKHKTNGRGVKQNHVTTKWEYFNEMIFVKDQIHLDINSKTKREKRNSHDIDKFEENNYFDGGSGDEDEYLNFDVFCETQMTEGDEILDGDFHENGELEEKDGISEESTEETEKLIGDRNKMKNQLEQIFSNVFSSLEDDNLCFLLSLLPQLKFLPNKRNLYVRMKMQELLLDEVAQAQNEK